MSHTPGPWAVKYGRAVVPADHMDRPIGASSNPEHDLAKYAQPIVYLPDHDWHRGDSELEANARLIAAAPALLKALRDLHDECAQAGFDTATDFKWPARMRAALAAIIKAEGRA